MVESEGADAVELVDGEVFTSGTRVDPSPTAGLAEQLKVNGRTGFGATGVAVLMERVAT